MTRCVHRHQVLVNDKPQLREVTTTPHHIAAGRLGVGPEGAHLVEFWVEHDTEVPVVARTYQVFGTGHPIPAGALLVGTTARTPEGLVWHLYELDPPEPGPDWAERHVRSLPDPYLEDALRRSVDRMARDVAKRWDEGLK